MSGCCAVGIQEATALRVMASPACGNRSKQVNALTVKSLVRHLPFGMAPAQYYYCEAPACDVVYFPSNPDAPLFTRRDLLVRVGAKEAADPVPVCYCFGITREDIRNEIRATGKCTVPESIKSEVQSGRCACEVKNPSGRCCLGNVIQVIKETGGSALRGAGSRSQISDSYPGCVEEKI